MEAFSLKAIADQRLFLCRIRKSENTGIQMHKPLTYTTDKIAQVLSM